METQAEFAGTAVGRGIGAVITACAGFVWFGWALSAFRAVPAAILLTYLLLAIALVSFALVAVRRGRKMLRALGAQRSDFWRHRRKPFWIVVFLEVVGCGIAVALVGVLRRPEWVAAGISLVVGLHFLPLGRIFEAPAYYWVGSLIVVADILALMLSGIWNPTALAAGATGAILWAASIHLLARSLRTVPAELAV